MEMIALQQVQERLFDWLRIPHDQRGETMSEYTRMCNRRLGTTTHVLPLIWNDEER